MSTATAQACANIAFIKYRLAKPGRTYRKVRFGDKFLPRQHTVYSDIKEACQ